MINPHEIATQKRIIQLFQNLGYTYYGPWGERENNLNVEDWVKLGFTEKQANTILNFKRSLGGKFKDANTLKKSYAISEEKFKELEPHLIFE